MEIMWSFRDKVHLVRLLRDGVEIAREGYGNKWSVPRETLFRMLEDVAYLAGSVFLGAVSDLDNDEIAHKDGENMGKRQTKYVDIALTEGDLPNISKMINEGDDVPGIMADLIVQGYSLTVKEAYGGIGFEAIIYGNEVAVNKGLALTAKGGNPYATMVAVLYKHHVKAEGGAWEGESFTGDNWLT